MKGLLFFILLFSYQVWGDETVITPVATPVAKPFKKLLIVSDFRTDGFVWSDLGLTQGQSFTGPIVKAWEKWLLERLGAKFDEIVICENTCQAFYQKWSSSLPELASEVDSQYNGSLFLKIDLHVKKVFNAYSWNGRMGLLEISTKRSLQPVEIQEVKKKWEMMDQKGMNSAFASDIYRFSLSSLSQTAASLEQERLYQKVLRVFVTGHKRLDDIRLLVTELETRSKELGIIYKVDSFGRSQTELLVYLPGEEKSFSDLLSQLKELKLSQSYKIMHETVNGKHELRLNE